jgi:hypothetical protein
MNNLTTTNEQRGGGVRTRRRWWLIGALMTFALLVVVGLLMAQRLRAGVLVTIHNIGATPLRSVVLQITGASYPLGDIAPGSYRETTVVSHGESNLEIEFTNIDGKAQRLDAGGYFESGYRGTIRVSINDGTIEANEQQFTLWSLW